MKLSQKLSKLIAERGWSLSELGRRSGLDPSLVSRLQSGEREWRVDHADAVARALEMSLEQLLDGTDREALLADRQYAQKHAAVDLEGMAEKLAMALAANQKLEATKRALEEELRQRPTHEQVNALQIELKLQKGARMVLSKKLQQMTYERDELRTEKFVSAALEAQLAERTKQAESMRKAALKWKAEAKRLGSKADVATILAITAFGFATVASEQSSAASGRRRPNS